MRWQWWESCLQCTEVVFCVGLIGVEYSCQTKKTSEGLNEINSLVVGDSISDTHLGFGEVGKQVHFTCMQ